MNYYYYLPSCFTYLWPVLYGAKWKLLLLFQFTENSNCAIFPLTQMKDDHPLQSPSENYFCVHFTRWSWSEIWNISSKNTFISISRDEIEVMRTLLRKWLSYVFHKMILVVTGNITSKLSNYNPNSRKLLYNLTEQKGLFGNRKVVWESSCMHGDAILNHFKGHLHFF